MRRHLFRFVGGGWAGEADPNRCAASVSRGCAGIGQCGNKPKPGTEWCGTHTVEDAPENPDLLWRVYRGELVGVPIVKETKKQIHLADRVLAFDCYGKIGRRDDGSPEMGFRTRYEAACDHVSRCRSAVERARENLKAAELEERAAEQLEAEISEEEQE